jgi:hypothetical protein
MSRHKGKTKRRVVTIDGDTQAVPKKQKQRWKLPETTTEKGSKNDNNSPQVR